MANLYPTLADFEHLGRIVEEMREQLDALEDKNASLEEKNNALEARCAELAAQNAQLEHQLSQDVTSSLTELREEVRCELQKRPLRVDWDLIDNPVELASGVTADTTMDVSAVAAPGNWVRVLVFARAQYNGTGRVAKVETVDGEGVLVSRGFVKIQGGEGRGSSKAICDVQDTFDLYIPSDGPASIRFSLTYGSGGYVSFTFLCTAVGVDSGVEAS